jgi:hypothetical protein
VRDSPVLLYIILASCVAVLAIWLWQARRPDFPDGVQVHAAPIQIPSGGKAYRVGDWTVTPLAEFRIEAMVLHTLRYRWDKVASLSPIDLAVGWGPMSDGVILDELQVSQGDRFFRWKYTDLIDHDQLNRHASNIHAIPFDNSIRRQLFRLYPGQRIQMSGELVKADSDAGWHIKSSLTRTDQGAGACEVLVVKDLEVLD